MSCHGRPMRAVCPSMLHIANDKPLGSRQYAFGRVADCVQRRYACSCLQGRTRLARKRGGIS